MPGHCGSVSVRHVGLSKHARTAFLRHAAYGAARVPANTLDEILRVGDWEVEAPARRLQALLADGSDATRRAAVAALALSFPARRPAIVLPQSLRGLYRQGFDRLAGWLDEGRAYDDDSFAKDVRLAAGLSVPAEAQDVDVGVRRSPGHAAARVRRALVSAARLAARGDAAGLKRFAAAGPASPWLQIHTDSRRLGEFHEAGWIACYGRIAELLALNPQYAGLVGQSWFYDPAVAEISPRLAYLQAEPLAHGAVRVRLGAGPLDVERATATSETRRRLYEAGRYRPRCWAIFWPRKALIAWAEARRAGPARAAA